MNPTKPWYASAGVWGALVTLAGSVLALLKIELDPALLEDVRDWLLSLATLIGGAVALWGRIRATRRIAPTPATASPDSSGRTGAAPPILLLLGCAALCATTTGGCALLTSPEAPYVTADRATYDAVAPEYRAYVRADPALDPEQRARRERTIETWRARLEAQEPTAHE